MYKSEIIADSVNQQGDRLTTFVVTFPRIVLEEFNTHRMFSRNSASSRAIPFTKMVKSVIDNPFIPIAWQKNHKGMQGSEYIDSNKQFSWEDISLKLEKTFYKLFDDSDITLKEVNELKKLMNNHVWSLFRSYESMTLSEWWLKTRDLVVAASMLSYAMGATKQLCNRLLEPFMWHKVIITSSEEGLQNFFNLRCPQYETTSLSDNKYTYFKSKKDFTKSHVDIVDDFDFLGQNKSQADIHIQAIAELMWDSYNESKPKQLKAGDWHIPFGDNIRINLFHKEKWISPVSYGDEILWNGHFEEVENADIEKVENVFSEGRISTLSGRILIKDCVEYIGKDVSMLKVKIATARCARISYTVVGDNQRHNYEKDIKLFDRLKSMEHWSCFEHCAVAMSNSEYQNYIRGEASHNDSVHGNPIFQEKEMGWCKNYKGFIQLRDKLD